MSDNRFKWDHLPQDQKIAHLYEWNQMLALEIEVLRAQVCALEVRLSKAGSAAEDTAQ